MKATKAFLFPLLSMKSMHTRVTIKQLLKYGWKKTKIAGQTGCHRNTVSNIAKEEPLKEKNRRNGNHPLDNHAAFIREKLGEGLTLLRIHEKLMAAGNYTSGYDAFRKYVKQNRLKQSREAFTVLHSAPGEEAQVDFGDVGKTPDRTGAMRKAYIFVMTLSHSRKAFHRTVSDQTADTFIDCHRQAFEYFGGVPEYVKIDNLKAAVIRHTREGIEFQQKYHAFSRYYGFTILPCGFRKPEQKGKVESGVKYVKRNFFAGRTFTDPDDLKKQLAAWQEQVCNERVHGTTRRIPAIVFQEEELAALRPLPAAPWENIVWETRRVSKTCHILIHGNYYSVPYRSIGTEVIVRVSRSTVKIYGGSRGNSSGEAAAGEKATEERGAEEKPTGLMPIAGSGPNGEPAGSILLAVHARLQGRGEYQTNRTHYPEGKRMSTAEIIAAAEARTKTIGTYAHAFFLAYRNEHPSDWGRGIGALVRLPESYGREAVDLACKRALQFEVWSCRTVANICRKWLWRNTDPPETVPAAAIPPVPVAALSGVAATDRRFVLRQSAFSGSGVSEIGRPLSYYAQAVL